jgi:hypothetical protein
VSTAIQNALTLALLREGVTDFATAEAFAARFVEDNDELFTGPPVSHAQALAAMVAVPAALEAVPPVEPLVVHDASGQPVRHIGPHNPAGVMRVPVVGPDGLTNAQREALAKNIPLCANCQQPTNDHLPGCAKASGEDPKARTKPPLAPVQ